MKGGPGVFPTTRQSTVMAVTSLDEGARARSLGILATTYWRPIYKHVRMKWRKSPDEAEELTQAFFARALERELFESYQPERARFRAFLRTCLDNFVVQEAVGQRRLKRGAGMAKIEVEGVESELAAEAGSDAETVFDREWVRCLFDAALAVTRAELLRDDKQVQLRAFERHDLTDEAERPSYLELASELGVSVTDVTNYLAAVRRRLRKCVLDKLRDMTASEEEMRWEAQELLGVRL